MIDSTYPDHDCDPRHKGYSWILQYLKAAFNDWGGYTGTNYASFITSKFEERRQYAMGKQSISKYKKILGVDEISDESWNTINWDVPSFLSKYREIAISKIYQKQFDLEAYAIDPIAQSDEDKHFNEMKVKIMMREAMEQMGSELAQHPSLAPQVGEAADMEELKMQQEFTYKHVMAMEAEMAIQLIMQQNNHDEVRKRVVSDLVDHGIGGYTTYIDTNGMVKYREIVPDNLIISNCVKNDFSDLVHWGEKVLVRVVDIVPYFTKEQLDNICKNVAGKYGNPGEYTPTAGGGYNRLWHRFQVYVFDAKLLSWNETVYKKEVDGRGNLRFGKTSYENKKYVNNDEPDDYSGDNGLLNIPRDERGQAKPVFMSRTKKVVYKGKWICGTDYMYDFGLSENMNRKKSSWWDTSLDLQLYAWNFNKMIFTGITERLIPLEDKACLIWYRLQNISNKVVPYIMNINMSMLEGLNFGKGGEKMKPSDVMNFIFSNFAAPFREHDPISGKANPNSKVVEIQDTGALSIFAQLYNELDSTINMMRQISGLNEATDASTINPKNLNSTNAAMVESTNNALYLITSADKQLQQTLADSIIQKVQIAVKLGKVEGYIKALGTGTVKFLQINPDISLHELGIFLREAPSEEQRQALWADVNLQQSQGLLDVTDKAMIMSCTNIKQAMQVLGYKIKKKQAQLQQYEMQKQQQAIQQQTEGNMQLEMMKQQTMKDAGAIELEITNAKGQWTYITEIAKKKEDFNEAELQTRAKIISAQVMADAKVIGHHISSEGAKVKQEIANAKPVPKAKTA